MIFLKISADGPSQPRTCVDVWQAVAATQEGHTTEDWFVTQPDHARLSGQMAAALRDEAFTRIPADIVEAIGFHDEGWSVYDGTADMPRPPATDGAGRALSFFHHAPSTFLRAWEGSIAEAARISPLASLVVGMHFLVLGRRRQKMLPNEPEAPLMEAFIAGESRRQKRVGVDRALVDDLLRALQFCDVLSLLVCSGSEAAVEFPFEFRGAKLQAQRENNTIVFDRTPFQRTLRVEVPYVSYGANGLVRRVDVVEIR